MICARQGKRRPLVLEGSHQNLALYVAPCSDSNFIISSNPFTDAIWNGVLPSLSSTPTFAPCSSSTRTTSTLLNTVVRCNGVLPEPSEPETCAFTSAPCSSNNRATLGDDWKILGLSEIGNPSDTSCIGVQPRSLRALTSAL